MAEGMGWAPHEVARGRRTRPGERLRTGWIVLDYQCFEALAVLRERAAKKPPR